MTADRVSSAHPIAPRRPEASSIRLAAPREPLGRRGSGDLAGVSMLEVESLIRRPFKGFARSLYSANCANALLRQRFARQCFSA
jgi:hypothetical protein